MAAPAPLHADRRNGRYYTAADRRRSGETSTHGGLTFGHLFANPFFHQLDGRDLLIGGAQGLGASTVFSRISVASGLETQGCCVRSDQQESAANKLFGPLYHSSSDVITSSADPNLDKYLGRALLRLANYFDV